jgi:hypothetical protein
MKKVGSGGPVRAIAFPQADAGLPDPTFFTSSIHGIWVERKSVRSPGL